MERIGETISARQGRTKELQQFAKASAREIDEDLASLAELTGRLLPD